jgi:hypothetical protein
MNVYKLKYTDKEAAITDLKAKGVYVETEEGLSYGQGVHAVVEIGKIIDKESTFDADFNIITEATYLYGYHYDVMCVQEIVFDNAITPNNPKHHFAGYYKPIEITDENILYNE